MASSDRGDNDLIFNFVFKHKDDLEIALKVGARDEQIRRKIIAHFGMSLVHELKSALDSVCRIENQGMFDRQKGLRIFKSAWQGKYWIELAPDRTDGRDMFVTVRNSGDPSANNLIKQRLDVLRHGISSGEWSWYFYLKNAYRDWSDPDVLLRMHGQDAELLEYVLREITAVIDTAGPVVDQVVSSRLPS